MEYWQLGIMFGLSFCSFPTVDSIGGGSGAMMEMGEVGPGWRWEQQGKLGDGATAAPQALQESSGQGWEQT